MAEFSKNIPVHESAKSVENPSPSGGNKVLTLIECLQLWSEIEKLSPQDPW